MTLMDTLKTTWISKDTSVLKKSWSKWQTTTKVNENCFNQEEMQVYDDMIYVNQVYFMKPIKYESSKQLSKQTLFFISDSLFHFLQNHYFIQ